MEKFCFIDKNGKEIKYYRWTTTQEIKGVVQLVHGMTEYALRYDYFAEKLCENGYTVYAHDQRGHGETSKEDEERGYIADNEGFDILVEDVKELTDIIKEENPNLPIILFAHSMGSFVTQRYIQLYGDKIDGVILSGTNGRPDKITKLGILISKIEIMLRGRKAKSKLMDKLSFGDFNSNFKPNRTNYDWLCSVEEEVDKYIESNMCGFICTTSFYYDLIRGLWKINKRENLRKIPKNLPIFIFAGDKDPVGKFGKGIIRLYNDYKELGIADLEYKLYKNGRHEMLNEKNKDEVIKDLIEWINVKVKQYINS